MSDDHPLTGQHAPIVLGHEFSGEIVALGEGVTGLRVGERVAPSAVVRCHRCASCLAGHPQLCTTLGFHGLSGGGGGFAEFDTFPAYLAHVLPDEVSDRVGALLEPLATGVHAVARAGIGAESTVLVLGGGPIGLMTVVAALAAGAKQVIVSEPAPARAKAAEQVGASAVLDPRETDVVAAVRNATGGLGVDAAFDAAAVPASFEAALGAVRSRGTVVNVGVWEQPVPFSPTLLLFTELNLTGALAYNDDEFETAVKIAASGRYDLEAMVTREIPLADAADGGIARLAADTGEDIKVLVRPS